MNENWENFLRWDDAQYLKRKKTHDKKQCELVIGWVAYEDQMARAHRSMGTLKHQVPTTSGVRQDRR